MPAYWLTLGGLIGVLASGVITYAASFSGLDRERRKAQALKR